jgi:hypothetical protein
MLGTPSIAEVAAVAHEMRVTPGSESAANKARVQAWLQSERLFERWKATILKIMSSAHSGAGRLISQSSGSKTSSVSWLIRFRRMIRS